MPSVPLPNNSDNNRSAVPSEFEQPGDGTEGTVDSSLNEAPSVEELLADKSSWIYDWLDEPEWDFDFRDGQPARQ